MEKDGNSAFYVCGFTEVKKKNEGKLKAIKEKLMLRDRSTKET